MSRYPQSTSYTIDFIRGKNPNDLSILTLYRTILHEAKDLRRWVNAFEIFSVYLAPIITSYQLNNQLRQAIAEPSSSHGSTGGSRWRPSPASSSTAAGTARPPGRPPFPTANRELGADDIRLISNSVALMVRYAPSPSEANVIYMFYLQKCTPPILSDETINHCLVSLIYLYGDFRNSPELQLQGLDLIKVALDRGIGLESYKAVKQREDWGENKGILASVSKNILRTADLQISEDGTKLVPFKWPPQKASTPFNKNNNERPQENRGRARPQPNSHAPQHGQPPQPRQGGNTGPSSNENSSWTRRPAPSSPPKNYRPSPPSQGTSDPTESQHSYDQQQLDTSSNHTAKRQQQQQQQRPSGSSSSSSHPPPQFKSRPQQQQPQSSQESATDDGSDSDHGQPSRANRGKSSEMTKVRKDKNRAFNGKKTAKAKVEEDNDQYSYYRNANSDENQAPPSLHGNRGSASGGSGRREINFVPASSRNVNPHRQDSSAFDNNTSLSDAGPEEATVIPVKTGARAKADREAKEIEQAEKKIEALRLSDPGQEQE